MQSLRLSENQLGDVPTQGCGHVVPAADLRPGQKVIIDGVVMSFYYFIGQVPVFTFNILKKQFNFFSSQITASTLVQLYQVKL